MKAIRFDRIGAPEEVMRCEDIPDPGLPGVGELLTETLAFPINPTDLLAPSGYWGPVTAPTIPGSESVSRVLAVGPGVAGFAPGDLVISLLRANWVQRRVIPAAKSIRLDPATPIAQAAMLRINPPTALGLMEAVTPLSPGDWVVQNAANSAVGQILNLLAQDMGLNMLNIIRRDTARPTLERIGARHILLDGPDLDTRIREATDNAKLPYLIDCIGGGQTARLMNLACAGGTVCTYGLLSGEEYRIPPEALLRRFVKFVGFSLPNWLPESDPRNPAIFARLNALLTTGRLAIPVRATYPIEDIQTAISAARQRGQEGKILVLPNGPIA